ncbi:MAG TPA: 50S ribosomal protein L18, partial [Thermoanaerobaculia bacterium]|nr:50S ribosomal protein L18 [Thermoanaerobaculia bacterium]
MDKANARVEARTRIHKRIRRRLQGTSARPRLAVSKSLKYISVQLVDDAAGQTLAHASSRESAIKGEGKSAANRAAAVAVGSLIAERAKEKG